MIDDIYQRYVNEQELLPDDLGMVLEWYEEGVDDFYISKTELQEVMKEVFKKLEEEKQEKQPSPRIWDSEF